MIQIPAPVTLIQITWACIGFVFARAFGKRLDQDIQNGEWFERLSPLKQNLVKRLLDFTHHFWIGLLMMLYCDLVSYPVEMYWCGCGIFLDDLPDVPMRFAKYFAYLNGRNKDVCLEAPAG